MKKRNYLIVLFFVLLLPVMLFAQDTGVTAEDEALLSEDISEFMLDEPSDSASTQPVASEPTPAEENPAMSAQNDESTTMQEASTQPVASEPAPEEENPAMSAQNDESVTKREESTAIPRVQETPTPVPPQVNPQNYVAPPEPEVPKLEDTPQIWDRVILPNPTDPTRPSENSLRNQLEFQVRTPQGNGVEIYQNRLFIDYDHAYPYDLLDMNRTDLQAQYPDWISELQNDILDSKEFRFQDMYEFLTRYHGSQIVQTYQQLRQQHLPLYQVKQEKALVRVAFHDILPRGNGTKEHGRKIAVDAKYIPYTPFIEVPGHLISAHLYKKNYYCAISRKFAIDEKPSCGVVAKGTMHAMDMGFFLPKGLRQIEYYEQLSDLIALPLLMRNPYAASVALLDDILRRRGKQFFIDAYGGEERFWRQFPYHMLVSLTFFPSEKMKILKIHGLDIPLKNASFQEKILWNDSSRRFFRRAITCKYIPYGVENTETKHQWIESISNPNDIPMQTWLWDHQERILNLAQEGFLPGNVPYSFQTPFHFLEDVKGEAFRKQETYAFHRPYWFLELLNQKDSIDQFYRDYHPTYHTFRDHGFDDFDYPCFTMDESLQPPSSKVNDKDIFARQKYEKAFQ